MRFSPSRGLKQFVSTFDEWHYLVGGVAIGWTGGWAAGQLLAITLC